MSSKDISSSEVNAATNSSLKDVGVFLREYQPQSAFRHGYKKTSSQRNCVAIGEGHIFAAQADKAVIHVYNREKGNQEATVPFPERIHSLTFVGRAGILVIGTEGGRLMLWEVATGRLSVSAASHLRVVSNLCTTNNDTTILSGSADASVHVWSLPSLISFSQASPSATEGSPSRSPLRTFGNHRQPISALVCGNSQTSTNFAISTATDQTCYVWSIATCRVLRTVLLPTVPLCLALDPADRAVYVGYDNGNIQSLDLFRSQSSKKHIDSIHNESNSVPIQLNMEGTWIVPTSDTGPANCLTITYDGTALLSGHDNGKVLAWDVGKGRYTKEVSDHGQPVTNLQMLQPDGFLNQSKQAFHITSVIKPRLELNAMGDNGTCGVPSAYILQAKLNGTSKSIVEQEYTKALTSAYFCKSMLDDALQNLIPGSAGANFSTNANPATDINLAKAERLEDQVRELNDEIAGLNKHIGETQKRKMARLGKREKLGAQKRREYLEAKETGQNETSVMDKWAEKEREIDMETESDDDGEDGEDLDE